jgi:hypothetical protein
MVIRYFGESGKKRVPAITIIPIAWPNTIENQTHSRETFQKYITSNTGMHVSIIFRIVPLGTYHFLGRSSSKYKNPRALDPTQHMPKTNINPVVKLTE